MQQPPERPFVPRPTPTRPQPAFGSSDFTLSRPFVPGTEREQITLLSFATTDDSRTVPSSSLPSSERFLDSPPANRGAGTVEWDEEVLSEGYADEDELPPVEHFTDPLPAVEEFAADATVGFESPSMDAPADVPGESNAESDWIETDWQQYDWGAAAALGESGDNEASHAWAATDWEAAVPRASEPRPTPAQAIASALDQLAQRIREGDLDPRTPGAVADPKTIAATLAAMLGIRQ